MRAISSVAFVAALFIAAALPSAAQEAATENALVRYDTDLLPTEFHENRRDAVREMLPSGAVAVVFSAPTRNRDNDVHFEYRQSSDLYYLTGSTEAATVLVLAPGGVEVDGDVVDEVLFLPPRDPSHEVWEGRLIGPDRAVETLGVAKAVSNERFAEVISEIAENDSIRFYHQQLPSDVDPGSVLGRQIAAFVSAADPVPMETGSWMASRAARGMMGVSDSGMFLRLRGWLPRIPSEDFVSPVLSEARKAFLAAADLEEWLEWREENIDEEYSDGGTLDGILVELRMIKTPDELALMQRAIDITAAAQIEAMRSIEPGMHEYEVEAVIEYVFRKNGSEYPGFPSIVASGENATILHYTTNRRRMQAEDMVVMDIGAEYHGYSADVTRTVPVSGSFSEEQRAIYELVLEAQQAGIEATQAGAPYQAPHEAASGVITAGLVDLGVMTGPEELRRFFMHGTSHYLGMSVHDVGDRGNLQPGTVITVEPGIYIRPSPDVDERWWNIGVRIEDDVLVTEAGPKVMSDAAPRTVKEIEALMSEQGLGNDNRGVVSMAVPVGASILPNSTD
ncbi:MAG: aminopeptidase P N-terminal domain-containing protein [Rhodothermia bacterium]|nr:aminopeptidase P N-terminal domain-containing protein [Rhodothermia bacterium]